MAEHYAEIQKVEGPFRVEYNGNVLAESEYAMELQEYHPSYEFQPVYYLPDSALHKDEFQSNDHQTSCPIKGKAAYLDLKLDGETVENIAWTYPNPLESARELENTYAFDPAKKVKIFRNGEQITRWGIRKKS